MYRFEHNFFKDRLQVGVEIRISGIGFIHTRSDIRQVLDIGSGINSQYPILWDWLLKFKINRVLGNQNGYRIYPNIQFII